MVRRKELIDKRTCKAQTDAVGSLRDSARLARGGGPTRVWHPSYAYCVALFGRVRVNSPLRLPTNSFRPMQLHTDSR
uniref:Uncharacterized protein n=1 Tax=Hyaloperonospora arabidopsidis (strain Emoy2) TaxID=559515 RepID=M4BF26_HYAAE